MLSIEVINGNYFPNLMRVSCVFCEIHTEYLYVIYINFFLQGYAMAQSGQPLASQYGDPAFDSGPVHVRFVVDKMAFGQLFF
jgi:hypothetical protein